MCKMALVRAASTDPLSVVESHLGSVDSWPPHVLWFMCIPKSNSRVVKQVAAFM